MGGKGKAKEKQQDQVVQQVMSMKNVAAIMKNFKNFTRHSNKRTRRPFNFFLV